MNIIDNNKYNEFRYILSGCRTILDAYYFANIYIKNNPEMKHIIYSMVCGKKYENVLDYQTMISILEDISHSDCQLEANLIIENNKSDDITQVSVFRRIVKNKPIKTDSDIKLSTHTTTYADSINLEKKTCPHCYHMYKSVRSTSYVICGYEDIRLGYDWKGCMKDWCFKCGKCLCKEWYADKLFMEANRTHNKECCIKHAKLMGKKYPDDYCQCDNISIER